MSNLSERMRIVSLGLEQKFGPDVEGSKKQCKETFFGSRSWSILAADEYERGDSADLFVGKR